MSLSPARLAALYPHGPRSVSHHRVAPKNWSLLRPKPGARFYHRRHRKHWRPYLILPWPNWAGKRVVLVGNGPSAPQNAALIDTYDIVVRIQGFPPDKAGKRWDFWFVKFTTPVMELCRQFRMLEHPRRAKNIITIPNKRVPFAKEHRVNIWTYNLGPTLERHILANRAHVPSSGLMALHAVLLAHPAEVALVGFDATILADTPTWKHWWGPAGTASKWYPEKAKGKRKHNFELEKVLMEKWLATRYFCGKDYPGTKPAWIRFRR